MAMVILFKGKDELRWRYDDSGRALAKAQALARANGSVVIDNGGGIYSVDANAKEPRASETD